MPDATGDTRMAADIDTIRMWTPEPAVPDGDPILLGAARDLRHWAGELERLAAA